MYLTGGTGENRAIRAAGYRVVGKTPGSCSDAKGILIWLKKKKQLTMNFRNCLIIAAVFLSALLVVQPGLSAENVTTVVTNLTADLENDAATKFFNYGEQTLNQGDYGNAIAFFDQALAGNTTILKKTDALLYLYRDKGYAQIQLGNYSAAIATLDQGIASYPEDAMLWNNRGYALERLNEAQDALASYDNAVSFDRNYTTAHINRGNVLSQLGRYPEAVDAYTQANATDPFNSAAAAGLEAAKKGQEDASRTMTIVLAVVVAAIIALIVWYVRFHKPA